MSCNRKHIFVRRVVVGLTATVVSSAVLYSWRLQAADAPNPSTTPTGASVTGQTKLPAAVPPSAGQLFICGGGILPTQVLERFVELAGGAAAKIVYVPTASVYAGTSDLEPRLAFWREQQTSGRLKSFEVVHANSREEAEQPAMLKPLQDATAVWFGGGVQSRLTERYLGTAFEREVKQLLTRGGLIGGTSAGAAIMSDVMICGGAPEPVIADGFGFLKNSVVDQHFIKRNRHTRLANALHRHPQRVGIGIDEGTALIVKGDQVEVIGDSRVLVCVCENQQSAFCEIKSGQNAQLTQAVAQAQFTARQSLLATKPAAPAARTVALEKVTTTPSRPATGTMPVTGK